ncbi:MAG TPA: UbiA family prenyltransferase [Nitrolancea sp.]|nr:UbiA family prenyltransferase [Nitrolancea sp.]
MRSLRGTVKAPQSEPSAFAAYVELLHLPPIAMVLLASAGFTVVAAGGRPPLGRLTLLLTSTLLGQLAISIHNDYCDRDLDAQAKPWRALPRGLLTPREAVGWTAGLTTLCLLLAVPLGLKVVGLIAIGASSGFGYNARLKRTAWTWLPFWVALPTLPLTAFAVVGHWDNRLWLVYLIGAPLVLAVYIADTLSDIESDSAHGVQGFAHRLGPRHARFVCWAAIVLAQALALAFWPNRQLPNPLFFLSVGALIIAIGLDRRAIRGGHWLAIMASAILLSLSWLLALTG